MRQILALVAVTFIFATVNAGGKPYTTPLKTRTPLSVHVSLLPAGKVTITWSAIDPETTATIYQIQKRVDKGEFKTVAILMGESRPTYSFRDKANNTSGSIEYRVLHTENNEVISTVSHKLVVL